MARIWTEGIVSEAPPPPPSPRDAFTATRPELKRPWKMRSLTFGSTLATAPGRRGGANPAHHVLVEGGLALAARQREDGGGRQGAEVPQRQGRAAAAQLQPQHRLATVSTRVGPTRHGSTIQSESVARQLIHFPYWGRAQL